MVTHKKLTPITEVIRANPTMQPMGLLLDNITKGLRTSVPKKPPPSPSTKRS